MKRVMCIICLMMIVGSVGCEAWTELRKQSKPWNEILHEQWAKQRKEDEEYRERNNIILYSERRHRELKLGMSQKEIYEIWGSPGRVNNYTTTLGVFTNWIYGENYSTLYRTLPDTSLRFFNYRLESIYEY